MENSTVEDHLINVGRFKVRCRCGKILGDTIYELYKKKLLDSISINSKEIDDVLYVKGIYRECCLLDIKTNALFHVAERIQTEKIPF